MKRRITKAKATKLAREFVAKFVRTGRAWDTYTMEPRDPELRFSDRAHFCDNPTIKNVANFIYFEVNRADAKKCVADPLGS